jgi:pseudouridylate synthase / pseudouridine kinase
MSETSNPSSMMFDTHDHSDTLQGLQHILPSESQPDSEIMAVDVVVAGSIAVDTSCDYSPVPRSEQVVPQLHVSNPSMVFQSIGGVGYNVSKAAQSLGASVKLCSAIGTDAIGHVALDMLSSEELSTKSVRMLDHAQNNRTAQYVAVNNAHNELVLAMADMRILEDVSADVLDVWMKELTLTKPKWLVVDANWKPHVIHQWLHKGKAQRCFTAFEPVSAAKAGRLFSSPQKLDVFPSQTLDLITPNQHELAALHHAASATGAFERPDWWAVIDALGLPATGSRAAFAAATSVSLVDAGIPQQSVQLLPFIPTVVTTLGERGILLTMLLRPEDPRLDGGHEAAPWILSRGQRGDGDMNVGGVYMRLFEPPEVLTPGMLTSVNGVGDTLTGVLVAGLATTGKGVELLLEVAQKAAAMTLRSKKSVSPSLGALRNCLKEMA